VIHGLGAAEQPDVPIWRDQCGARECLLCGAPMAGPPLIAQLRLNEGAACAQLLCQPSASAGLCWSPPLMMQTDWPAQSGGPTWATGTPSRTARHPRVG